MDNKRLLRNTMFILLITVFFVLTACSSDEETVTYQLEETGINIQLSYKAEGDEVIEQTTESELEYEVLGIASKEEAEELLNPVVEQYQDTKGVTHEIEFQEDKAIEKLVVDMKEADLEALSQLEGANFEGDTSGGISLEKSVEMLKQQGFEKVE